MAVYSDFKLRFVIMINITIVQQLKLTFYVKLHTGNRCGSFVLL